MRIEKPFPFFAIFLHYFYIICLTFNVMVIFVIISIYIRVLFSCNNLPNFVSRDYLFKSAAFAYMRKVLSHLAILLLPVAASVARRCQLKDCS